MKEAACCLYFCKCVVLGYHMAVIPALCLNVDQKQAAESLGCECEPPACLNPTEPCKSCGCTSTTGLSPALQQDGSSQQQGCCAQQSLHGILLRMQAHISHPWAQTATHSLWHTLLFTRLTCVAGPHNPRLHFPRCVQVKEGNNTTNSNILTSPNKSISQEPFHLN